MKFVLLLFLIGMIVPAFAQNSTENQITMMNNSSDNSIALFGILITAIVGLCGFIANRINHRYQKKQLQTTTLFKIYELLSNEKGRTFRRLIYDEWKRSKGKPEFDREVIYEGRSIPLITIVEELLSNYDKVCAMVTLELVSKKMIFELYSVMLVKSYIVMKEYISKKQITNRKAALHYSTLAKEFDSKVPENEKKIY
ncbi:hypothetical protein [Candidatus Nitrosopumilus sediminis]|uniref:DUF4760 domain-containing protein n=1 Tax=Candidatus Nitrosopumilus sediminis TaxID=1229909 RepID=K0BC80_9ARCH|nr:hypothetical protein [Candidatus Nitrosopumilus sediminis]AFS82630.1 hypothetical protein NSED_04120 [Candidatus Nitrosopumilus sediminis]